MAMEMNKVWTPKSVIYFLDLDGDSKLIEYFNPATNVINKKIISVSFGYEVIRGEGLPTAYKALFQLKAE